jgi:hypothetical protein
MSTADNKTGHGAAWANLIVCGGISWSVSLWHATHAAHGASKVLAILVATAPVVTAAFASHNVVQKGAGWTRRIMTFAVFAMGMALSIKAQSQSVAPFVGGIELGVVFALMLDVSTFLALGSIMSRRSVESPADRSVDRPQTGPQTVDGWSVDRSADRSVDRSVDRPADRSVDRPQTVQRTIAGPTTDRPADRPADRPKAAPAAPARPRRKTSSPAAKAAKATDRGTVEDQVRLILAAEPNTSSADVARKIGREPGNGTVKTACSKVRQEMQEDGAIEAPAEVRLRAVSE